jgi:hypothetical protein
MDSDAFLLAGQLPTTPPNWERLGEQLPLEWIEQALQYTGRASIRKRRLPAEQVVWFVIGLALYRHKSVRQLLAELDLALPDLADRCVTDSAVTQARQRLGEEPLEQLFNMTAQHWQQEPAKGSHVEKLQLFAMDGTSLRLADSMANRKHFGSSSFRNGGQGSHPMARLVTLNALSTQMVVAARFDAYDIGEMTHAKLMVQHIPDQSLTIFDRGFLAAELLHTLCQHGLERHFLVPAKGNTKWTVISGDDTDAMVELQVSPASRKLNSQLPATWQARAIRCEDFDGKAAYLLTSLIDRRAYPAGKVRECYRRRWQIETSYREIKQTMMGMALSLRSHDVETTRQEIWGILIAYNLIRLEMARAAVQVKCAPTEISFILALHAYQYEMMSARTLQSLGTVPALIKRMRERILTELNVYRPDRKFDRVIKAKPQRYPERRLRKTLT